MALRVGLTHTQMKLGRAYEHLGQLKRELALFVESKPCTERRYDDVDKSRHIISIEQHVTPDPVGILIGEFSYCVRSSLDHLAWQLALLTTDNPGRPTAFPIESTLPKPSNKSFNEKIADIPLEALKVIKSLQPYNCGPRFKDHPLWKINKLCNIDKHQVIAISSIDFELAAFGVSQAWGPFHPDHNTTAIAIPLAEKSQVDFKVRVAGIVFGEPIDRPEGISGFEVAVAELDTIYDFVRYKAVPQFERFFK